MPRPLLAAFLLAAVIPSAFAQRDRVPEGTKAFVDVSYVTNGHAKQKLDLYVPENATAPTPVVIWIHGGGWAAGDKSEGCPPLNSGFTKRGYAAVSLNYRLSGDAIYPAQIEDCKAALRWLRAHAKEYNLDPTRFGVWGASAGGHLVALLGAAGNTREFDVGENLDQSSAVQAVSDFYGPTDILQMDAHAVAGARLIHNARQSPESRLVGGPLQEKPYCDLAARVNPIPFLSKNAPPYLIVHGSVDPLVPHHQSELLYAALTKLGIPVRFHTINGAEHGRGFGGKEIGQMAADFFDYRLLGKENAAAKWAVDMTSESEAVWEPARPGAQDANRRGPGWEQIQEREDANHDGKVTRDEFKGPPQMWETLDRNHDGVLTKDDFAGAPGANRPAAQDQERRDGERRGPTWEQIREREDANRDGKVTREEFKGPPQMFDLVDRDRDGALTAKDFADEAKTSPNAEASTRPVVTGLGWTSGSAASVDGQTIPYLVSRPKGKGPFPVIVYVHGAPGGVGEAGLQNVARQSRWAMFVEAGYAVCLADYRGHPEKDPFAVLQGPATSADDVAAVIAQLGKSDLFDTKRLAYIGGSLGGATGLLAASQGKVAPAALVLIAPASFRFIGIRGRPDLEGRDLGNEDFDHDGTLSRVTPIASPTLIIQGTGDKLVALNKALASVFKEAGKDVQLELFEGENHSFTNGPDSPAYRRAAELTLAFIEKNVRR
ncbi:MAG: alpha/beta fold hydrolase [Nocardioides sp.]